MMFGEDARTGHPCRMNSSLTCYQAYSNRLCRGETLGERPITAPVEGNPLMPRFALHRRPERLDVALHPPAQPGAFAVQIPGERQGPAGTPLGSCVQCTGLKCRGRYVTVASRRYHGCFLTLPCDARHNWQSKAKALAGTRRLTVIGEKWTL